MNKVKKYDRLYLQLRDLIKPDVDLTANMATICAVLYHKIDYFFWCGFYRLVDADLIVGPYQGPVACVKLEKNKGVCWNAVLTKKTVIVDDVHQFPGHIACNALSLSEIVVPVKNNAGCIIAVLDIDSKRLASFNQYDAQGLELIAELLKE